VTRSCSDEELLVAQLREYVLARIYSPEFARAAQGVVRAITDAVTQAQAEEQRRQHPRITNGLPAIHRRYRRPT